MNSEVPKTNPGLDPAIKAHLEHGILHGGEGMGQDRVDAIMGYAVAAAGRQAVGLEQSIPSRSAGAEITPVNDFVAGEIADLTATEDPTDVVKIEATYNPVNLVHLQEQAARDGWSEERYAAVKAQLPKSKQ